MAEKVVAGPVCGAGGIKEATCIHTKKIYSSCKDKDCIEDLAFYPTVSAQQVLSTAQSIRGGRVELLYVGVDVEPVSFNRGFYAIDMRFYYRVILQAMNSSMRYTEVEGLATFDKRVVLYGSEKNSKIYSSVPIASSPDVPLDLTASLPVAYVEAVDPLLLCAKIIECANGRCCDCPVISAVPEMIAAAFDEALVFDAAAQRRVCISIGQFSIVRLERDTQLLIPIYDYCIPSDECPMLGSVNNNCDDPCEMFDAVEFPINDFFPPKSEQENCYCR